MVLGVLLAAAPFFWLSSEGGGGGAVAVIIAVGVGLGLLLLLIVVGIALSVLTTLVHEYAQRACVLDTKGIFDALGNGIRLTRSRFRESALMWLLLMAINIVASLVAIPLVLLGLGGSVAPALAVWGGTESIGAAVAAAVPFLLVFVLVGALLGGIYIVFQSAVWTLTFRELGGSDMLVEETA